MTIPQFFIPNIHPQVVDQGGAPDFWSAVLGGLQPGMQAGLTGYKEQQQNSRSSAENEIRKAELAIQQQHFKLLQEQEKTKQAHLAHQQEVTNQVGSAYNEFLTNILPHAVQTGQAQQLMGGMGGMQQGQPQQQQPSDQFGIPQGLPFQQAMGGLSGLPQQAPQLMPRPLATPQSQQPNVGHADPFEALAKVLPGMDPEAIPVLMAHIAPIIAQFDKTSKGGKNQAVQTGEMVTTFDPDKGFYNPKTGTWQPSIDRGMDADAKRIKGLEIALAEERLAAMKEYRQGMEDRVLKTQFDRNVKDLKDRGRIVMQAIQTIGDARDNPVLYSSAIANFVQAADQKAQLRYQLLNYFKQNVDPSIGGRWETLKSRLLNGTLPKYVSSAMLVHLNNLVAQSRSEFEKHRAAEIKRHPSLAGWLPEADEFFTSDTTAAPKGGTLDQFIPPPGQ